MSFLAELYYDIKQIPTLFISVVKALCFAGCFALILLVPIYIEIIYIFYFNNLLSIYKELILVIIIQLIWTLFIFCKLDFYIAKHCTNSTQPPHNIKKVSWNKYTIYMKVKNVFIGICITGFFVLFLFFLPSLRHGLADNIECGDNGICIHYDRFINESSNSTYNQWCDSKYQQGNWKLAYIEDIGLHNRFGILSNSTTYIQPIFEDKKNYLLEDRFWDFNMNGWRELFGKNITYKSCIAR